jgi:N-acetyl-gamma-glutamyl-phosphate reductase
VDHLGELVRLLACHQSAAVTAVSSVSYEGQRLSDIYPNLYGVCDLTLTNADDVISSCDVVFASLPHGLSEEIAAKCRNTVLIDLGADFRLTDEAVYKKWYGKDFLHPELHKNAVYCIPELHRSQIKSASVIANPGCYPTAAALALAPALTGGFIEKDGIIIDSKSGVTGAGRGLTQNTHFPDTNEAFSAYKAGAHRHTPEIEQTLTRLAGTGIKVTFIPHLLPVNRGIESKIYCRPVKGMTYDPNRKSCRRRS